MTAEVVVWLREVHAQAERLACLGEVWTAAGWGVFSDERGTIANVQLDDASLAELIALAGSPAAVLARVEAERAILAHHASDGDDVYPMCTVCDTQPSFIRASFHRPWPCPTVRLLAAGWKHMPGYDPAWSA